MCGLFEEERLYCHEERHPSEVRRRDDHLRLRQCYPDALHGEGYDLQRLLGLSPLLHG